MWVLFNILDSTSKFDLENGFTIEFRGPSGWALLHNSFVYSKSEMDFVYEPSPSNRDNEFIKDTRFNTVPLAYITYKKVLRRWKRENYHKKK